jgi:hypothetical protein
MWFHIILVSYLVDKFWRLERSILAVRHFGVPLGKKAPLIILGGWNWHFDKGWTL